MIKNIMSTLSFVQAVAMAAERRLWGEIWCAFESGGLDAEDIYIIVVQVLCIYMLASAHKR